MRFDPTLKFSFSRDTLPKS